MNHEPGDILDGTYELVERLGSGGLSVVWKSRRSTNGDTVAIKFPNLDEYDQGTVRRGFERERTALQRLSSGVSPRSVLQLLDTGRTSEPYLVVEYIDGPDLATVMEETRLAPGSAATKAVALELCRAVDFMETRNVVHLDLRPKNILLRGDCSPVVVDFNTARTESNPNTLFRAGRYKPPEVLRSGQPEAKVGHWSDLYSLGKIVLELLNGQTEALEKSTDDQQVATEIERKFGLEADFKGCLARAVEPNPNDRASSPVGLLQALSTRSESSSWPRIKDKASRHVGCLVLEGDSVGRAKEGDPNLVIVDENQYVSPEHFSLDTECGTWTVRDTSLNGTYVKISDEWIFLLSKKGRRRLAKTDEHSIPGTIEDSIPLDIPVAIRPVDPEYGTEFRLEPADLSRNFA